MLWVRLLDILPACSFTCACLLVFVSLCMKRPPYHRTYVWNEQSQREFCLCLHLKIHESHGKIDFQSSSQLFLAGCQSNWAIVRQHPHSVLHRLQRCQFCLSTVIVLAQSWLRRAQRKGGWRSRRLLNHSARRTTRAQRDGLNHVHRRSQTESS